MKKCGECLHGSGACSWRNILTTPPSCRVIYIVNPVPLVWTWE
jgi:hypothetical protein